MRALENELLLTAKQLDEERSRQRELKKKVDEVEEEKGVSNQEYEVKIAQVQADMEELKNRLVEVTRYGDSKSSLLWSLNISKKVQRLSNNCRKRSEFKIMSSGGSKLTQLIELETKT